MDYTNKYHLPQWKSSDRILMDDFNQMCLNMEAGLEEVRQDAASNASSAAGSASAAANAAQSTADSAVAKADAAQAAADAAQATADRAFHPNYLPYKTGSFTGNGTTVSVTLGFKPSFVIISAQTATSSGLERVAIAGPSGNLSACIQFTSTGMSVTYPGNPGYPIINSSGTKYSYIAFR